MPARLCVSLGSIAVAAFWLAGELRAEPADEPFNLADSELEPVRGADIAGWAADDHLAAFAAYQAICQTFRGIKQPHDERPGFNAPWPACRGAARRQPTDKGTPRHFLEGNFR